MQFLAFILVFYTFIFSRQSKVVVPEIEIKLEIFKLNTIKFDLFKVQLKNKNKPFGHQKLFT